MLVWSLRKLRPINSMSDPIGIMSGKRGLIMGVANERSIAWGIAQAIALAGGEMAFTYQGEAFEKRVRPLAEGVGSDIVLECDVEKEGSVKQVFNSLAKDWKSIDFIVHSLAFSDKNELNGRYIDTTFENFKRTMKISCFSLTEIVQFAYPMMKDNGASVVTLSYLGAERVLPNYNVLKIQNGMGGTLFST